MAPLAARRLAEMVALSASASSRSSSSSPAQAVDLRGRPTLGEGTGRAYGLVRERVPFMGEGDPIPQDLEPVVELVRSGAIACSGPVSGLHENPAVPDVGGVDGDPHRRRRRGSGPSRGRTPSRARDSGERGSPVSA